MTIFDLKLDNKALLATAEERKVLLRKTRELRDVAKKEQQIALEFAENIRIELENVNRKISDFEALKDTTSDDEEVTGWYLRRDILMIRQKAAEKARKEANANAERYASDYTWQLLAGLNDVAAEFDRQTVKLKEQLHSAARNYFEQE